LLLQAYVQHIVHQVVPMLHHGAVLEWSTHMLISKLPFEHVQALSLRKDELLGVRNHCCKLVSVGLMAQPQHAWSSM
jgi:hypothetical protein